MNRLVVGGFLAGIFLAGTAWAVWFAYFCKTRHIFAKKKEILYARAGKKKIFRLHSVDVYYTCQDHPEEKVEIEDIVRHLREKHPFDRLEVVERHSP